MTNPLKGFRVPLWMAVAIKELAEKTGENQSQVIIHILEKRLNELGYRSELDRLISNQTERLPDTEANHKVG